MFSVMRLVVRFIPTIALLPLGAIASSQPWTKNFTQWTAADADRILNESPWAQQATASFGPPLQPEDMPVTPPPGAENHLAGSRGVSDGRWDGGVARNTGIGETPTLAVTVRWESALPVRQALARSQNDPSRSEIDNLATRARNDYVVTVLGLASAAPRKTAQPDGEPDDGVQREPQDPAQISQAFIINSRLILRGKVAIPPENAKYDPATGAVHLYFSRSIGIKPADKEVIFATRFGSLNVQKKFHLKEMTYKGQLEL